MNAKLIKLAERRAALVARAATQRAELSQAWTALRRPLGMMDQGLMAAGYIRSHAGLLGDVVVFVASLRSWRMAKWLRRVWLLWRMTQAAKRILPSLRRIFSVLPRRSP